jgi:hypothetical protein
VRLFRREGAAQNTHDHSEVRTIVTESDSTDGLEVTARALPEYPEGVLVMMNSSARNFLFYDWRGVVAASASGVSAAGNRFDLLGSNQSDIGVLRAPAFRTRR